MPDANIYVNMCIFIIITYAMRYPVKSILCRKPQQKPKRKYTPKKAPQKKVAYKNRTA